MIILWILGVIVVASFGLAAKHGDDGETYTADGTHYNPAGNVEAANQWKTALGY